VSDESEEGQRSDSDSDSDKSPRRGDSSSPSESGGRKKLGYGTIHDAKERSQVKYTSKLILWKYLANNILDVQSELH